MKLLDKSGFLILLEQLNKKLIPKNTIISTSPEIIHKTPTNKQLVLDDVQTGQYILIHSDVEHIKINNIKKSTTNNQNILYIQFTSSESGASIVFDNIILWENGNPILIESNKSYRVKITKYENIYMGEWYTWQINV